MKIARRRATTLSESAMRTILLKMQQEIELGDTIADEVGADPAKPLPDDLPTPLEQQQVIQGNDDAQSQPNLLIDLINQLRPVSSRNVMDIGKRLDALITVLTDEPTLAGVLVNYLLTLITRYRQLALFSENGISDHQGFVSSLVQRLSWRVLPPVRTENNLQDLFGLLFHHETDWRWLDNIPDEHWKRLFACFEDVAVRQDLLAQAQQEMLEAVMLTSYRLTAVGMEPELLRASPDIESFSSPFLVQNREVIEFLETYREKFRLTDNGEPVDRMPDSGPAEVMLEQCHDIMLKVRRATRTHGVSITLTQHLLRIEQSINRMLILFGLLSANPQSIQKSMVDLLLAITQTQRHESSIRALISNNTRLLSLQITENASRTGEHYVTDDKKGYLGMWRSAMGGGLVIAFLATFKVLMGKLAMAPMLQALANGLNYGLGFMFIHVLHFTVATKQPAMTAAAMAATVQQNQGRGARKQQAQLNELTQLIVNIFRTQFAAILGNISIAMPVGLLIAWVWLQVGDHHLMSHDKAMYILQGIHPFKSLALMYAAIAGVCLFLAGLIAGYYDNMAVYNRIGDRIRQHPRLIRLLKPRRLEKVATYIENNLGALAGNFWFGMMLGSMPVIGYITGLPLDIRHIAFSSANLTQALFALPFDLGLMLISFLGVLMIGMVNLLVSFSLALTVALRARQVSFTQWLPLASAVLGRFISQPSQFFLPPKPADHKQESITF